MSVAEHRRVLEHQARAHRQHVKELHDRISQLMDDRDALNIQLKTRREILKPL